MGSSASPPASSTSTTSPPTSPRHWRRFSSRPPHHRRPELFDRRRADLLHDGEELRAQQLEHALDAALAEGAEPPDIGRPTPTAVAPVHRALQISAPRRKPESISTGMRPPTASTISGSASMVARPESSLRAPWFDTMIAS